MAALLGYKPIYFRVYDSQGLRACLIGFITTITKLSEGAPMHRKIRFYANRLASALQRRRNFIWNGQPVCIGTSNPQIYECLANAIEALLRDERLHLVRGEWPTTESDGIPSLWQKMPWATLQLDLRVSREKLNASLKPAARKEIRKAESKGIAVRRVESGADLERYISFAKDCAQRYDGKAVNAEDYRMCWRALRNKNIIFETFVAEIGADPVAGLSVWGTKHCIMEIGSFQAERSYLEKLPGPDLIKWRVIEWAQKCGIESFDLAGINPEPRSEKEANIRKFKEKWGGKRIDYLILSD